jgi:hypothetical protein
MADFLSELASGAGLEADQTHHGVGALLAILKSRLNPEAYAHVKNAIPNSEGALSAFQDKAASADSGFMDTMKNMAGKLFGRQESAALQEHFASAGLSLAQLQCLLPRLHDMLAGKVPPHVLDQIKQHVPGFGPAAGPSEEE